MTIAVAVIVPTYNRPKLLREALASTTGADQVIVVDDGSTYDVRAHCADLRVTDWLIAEPLTVDQRMTTPRQGRLINQALELVRCDVVTLLCDDDLHAPGWYDALRAVYAAEPERELVRGEWRWFTDGETPTEDSPLVPLDVRQMTAGNFAHRADLMERGVRWPENHTNCLDDGFLYNAASAGVQVVGLPSVGLAGWRREHEYINGRHSDGRHHTPSFREVLERGYLE